MLSEEQIEFLIEKLLIRTEKANTFFLEKIGETLLKMREISSSKAFQLAQILKYGENYDKIIKELTKYSKLSISEVDSILNTYAQKDYSFYKKFYEYRNINFVPLQENVALRMQVQAFSNLIKNEMYNYFNTNVLGYSIIGLDGRKHFVGLKKVYDELIDTALLNVTQGKQNFDQALSNSLKQIGNSGLKTIDYKSGRAVRLDSTMRMNLKDRIMEYHNEVDKIVGAEIGTDGVEISVHENPAPDHAKVQGKQFSNEEFLKLQNGEIAKDYEGKFYSLDHDNKNSYRPISQMNCYHSFYSIILGLDKPEYSDKELKNILRRNENGFEFEGQHYTFYEGTQMQRMIEREIRKEKDIKTMAKISDNKKLLQETTRKIKYLTTKYKTLSQASNLPVKSKRLVVQ